MEIVDGLHKMQASMKRPATKTASAKLPSKKKSKYMGLKGAKLVAAVGG
jgi:hypothetical protein